MRKIILLCFVFFCSLANAANEPPTYDLDFGGGSALDFAEVLSELEINAIYPENAGLIAIPRIRLRNVSQQDLFNALNIVGNDAAISFSWHRSGNDFPTIIQADGQVINDVRNQIWVLTSTGSKTTAQPFAIGHLLPSATNEDGYSVDDITSAIAAAAEASATAEGRISELDFKYHEGTQLLIITGRVEDVRVASQTLTTLRQSNMGGLLQGEFGAQFGGLRGQIVNGLEQKMRLNYSSRLEQEQ